MPLILSELKQVPYLNQIVIGLDRASESQYQDALRFFSDLPQNFQVLWNDGSRLKALDQKLQESRFSP